MLDYSQAQVYVYAMTIISVATAASQILTTSISALKELRERAKKSKDNDLKERISALYDSLLSLKEALLELTQENAELQQKIAELESAKESLPELRQIGACNFYFVGEKGPYCQVCYDGKGKLTVLSPQESWNGGIRRQCRLCREYFYEKPMSVGGVFVVR